MELQFIPLYDDDLKCRKIKVMATNDKKETKEVGCIFTPSSSGNNITNAIQVCGFLESFDLWGCARYTHPKINDVLSITKSLTNERVQAKDIQLQFLFDTEKAKDIDEDACQKCFNIPCTCEVHVKHENPYTVKRETDLGGLEYKEKDKK